MQCDFLFDLPAGFGELLFGGIRGDEKPQQDAVDGDDREDQDHHGAAAHAGPASVPAE